jgi:hypothetical protein
LYGYDAPSFVDLEFGDNRAPKAKDWIQEIQDILRDSQGQPTDDPKSVESICRQAQGSSHFRGGRLGFLEATTIQTVFIEEEQEHKILSHVSMGLTGWFRELVKWLMN